MQVLWLLVPVSLVLGCVFLAAFLWSASSGQLDDLDDPAERMLHGDR